MPIPLIIAGAAAVAVGAGGHICAKETNEKATALSEKAKRLYEDEKKVLELKKEKTEKSLSDLGYKKKDVLDHSMKRFLNAYEKIKEVQVKESVGLNEISNFMIDEQGALEMRKITSVYSDALKSGAAGAVTGAVISLAASGTVSLFTSAAAIGGVGMATSVVGSSISLGLATTPVSAIIAPIAAPVVLFTGISASVKADENLEKAQTMYAQAEEAVEKMKVSETMCEAISERADMFRNLLEELDFMFAECSNLLDEVVQKRDSSIKRTMTSQDFSEEELKLIAVTRSLAGAVKSVIDTPILSSNGEVESESEIKYNETQKLLPSIRDTVTEVKLVDYKALREEEEQRFFNEKEIEIQKYCEDLRTHSCEELWEKLQDIQVYAYPPYFKYCDQITNAMKLQEKIEQQKLLDAIEVAGLDELDGIYANTHNKYYSKEIQNNLENAINARKYNCQKEILDSVMTKLDDYSRDDLKDIIMEINSNDFIESLASDYIKKLKVQYDLIEERELREICTGIEDMDIPELNELYNRIGNNNYQITCAKKYFDMIDTRIEYIHIRNLEMFCKDINDADRQTLSCINNNIKAEDCAENIKNKFYQLVAKREEVLDYNELCELTKDVDKMSIEQLEELLNQLKQEEYNPKFIKKFILQTRVALENAQCKYVNELVRDYAIMDKNKVYDTEYAINQRCYPGRIVKNAICALSERKYVLDMHELIDMDNDFDNRDLYELNNIRSLAKQKNVSDRSRTTYLQKVRERELAIAYKNVSKYASYIYNMFSQYNIKTDKYSIPVFTESYKHYYQEFLKQRNNEENLEDIPALIYPDGSMLAVTKNNLYVMVGSEYKEITFENIRDFSVEKKFLTDMLILTYADGNSLVLKNGITKGNSQFLAYLLNDIIRNSNNESIYSSYNEYNSHIENYDKNSFTTGKIPIETTYEVVSEIYLDAYRDIENKYGKSSSIKDKRNENWDSIETKIKTGFGISSADSFIMYFDKTFFNSAKEGFALGKEAMYIKDSGKPFVSIKYTEIYSIESNKDGLVITTTNNSTYFACIRFQNQNAINDFALIVDDYVKGVQLLNVVAVELDDMVYENDIPQSSENCEVETAANLSGDETVDNNQPLFCFNCGNKLNNGAVFCSQCGTKVR